MYRSNLSQISAGPGYLELSPTLYIHVQYIPTFTKYYSITSSQPGSTQAYDGMMDLISRTANMAINLTAKEQNKSREPDMYVCWRVQYLAPVADLLSQFCRCFSHWSWAHRLRSCQTSPSIGQLIDRHSCPIHRQAYEVCRMDRLG